MLWVVGQFSPAIWLKNTNFKLEIAVEETEQKWYKCPNIYQFLTFT